VRFNPEPKGDYLAFLAASRRRSAPIAPSRIARRVGLPLKIAAKVDAQDKAYFEREIEPLLGTRDVEFVARSATRRSRLPGQRARLLFPSTGRSPSAS
jgi:hypothetical protein